MEIEIPPLKFKSKGHYANFSQFNQFLRGKKLFKRGILKIRQFSSFGPKTKSVKIQLKDVMKARTFNDKFFRNRGSFKSWP